MLLFGGCKATTGSISFGSHDGRIRAGGRVGQGGVWFIILPVMAKAFAPARCLDNHVAP